MRAQEDQDAIVIERDGVFMKGLPINHQHDEVAVMSRFRQVKLTDLDLSILPRQN